MQTGARAFSYLVCTSPRTGSTLLTDALTRTGVAGRPEEYFDIHARNEHGWIERLKIAGDSHYLAKVIDAATTANGVFGVKVHWHQFRVLQEKLAASTDAPRKLGARFPRLRYIWLTRRNKVAQAISYYRAAITDRWRDWENVPRANTAEPDCLFDFEKIDSFVTLLNEFDASWKAHFEGNGIAALSLTYEELISDYEPALLRVIDYLGLSQRGLEVPPPRLRKQADETSFEWERRYRTIKKEREAAPAPRDDTSRSLIIGSEFANAMGGTAMDQSLDQRTDEMITLPLRAFSTNSALPMSIATAPRQRDWMEQTDRRFANRCLPLLIANQAGWFLLGGQRVAAVWDGGDRPDALKVELLDGPGRCLASSHFGSGILTWHIPYVFRTTPGFNLLVRGPANLPKDGIYPLEGIVETDWTEATFTVNWKMTRPSYRVVFEIGEPIAMLVPQPRGELECFRPEIHDIRVDPALHAAYTRWEESRRQFNQALKQPDSPARKQGWQKHYFQGASQSNAKPLEHQQKLNLREFIDCREGSQPP